MSPNVTLYLALALYAAGTLAALASLFGGKRLQNTGLVLMLAGFVSHTAWIGSICVRTHHPPLTNLPEIAAFLSWTIFVVELDDEDRPGEERRDLRQVRQRRVMRAHADRADPCGVADEAGQHQHQPRVLQPLPAEERRQRGQRA